MNVISRKNWGARPPARVLTAVPWSQRRLFVVHYSYSPTGGSVRSIQDHCMDARGFADIDYNMLVDGASGVIYEGCGWTRRGTHTKGHNTEALGICVITRGSISAAAKRSVQELYQYADAQWPGRLSVLGHGDVTHATDCPGATIRAWVRAGGVQALAHKPEQPPRLLRMENPYMRGADVRQVQIIVHAVVDDVYGPHTCRAVADWQRSHGLTPDGIVGPKTRAKMGI